jgi:hypothetical protein
MLDIYAGLLVELVIGAWALHNAICISQYLRQCTIALHSGLDRGSAVHV